MDNRFRLVVAVVLTWAGALAVSARDSAAQGTGQYVLQRLDGPIDLDGVVNEAEWNQIEPLPMTMYRPTFRGQQTERTEIRVAYDDEFFYASGRFYDSDPSGIRTNSLYRDRWSGDDTFALFIDTFNDNENALWFTTNPAGVRMDRTIARDGSEINSSWDTFWDAVATVTEEGWFAEIRIPLSSLGFQSEDGRVVMGLTATRLIARKNERVTFPAIDPQLPFRRPSVAQDVVLEGVMASTPAYLTPYVLSGVDRTPVPTDLTQGFSFDQNVVNEMGFDLKYNITDNLTADFTVNTDFAQVEVDDEQINLTRFSLFFPEKRQFFQERSGIFSFNFGTGGRLFHSRRIGLADNGEPIRILAGARFVGRMGDWDLGVIDMQTARADTTPAENFGVLRARRRSFNQFSYVGGLLTTRLNENGGYNVAAGLDAFVKIFGNDYLTVKSGHTFDGAMPNEASLLDRSQFVARWERRSLTDLRYEFLFSRSGSDYLPEVGFVRRRDFTQYQVLTGYNRLARDDSPLRSLGPAVVGNFIFRNEDATLESLRIGHWWDYEFKSGASGWVEGLLLAEDIQTSFTVGGEAEIPVGRYMFGKFWFRYESGPGNLLRAETDFQIGSFYDGWRGAMTLSPTWNVSRFLELGGSYELNIIRFPERDQGVDTHLARFRVRAAANAKLSTVAFIQYNSVADLIGVNVRFRYNFKEGNDLWIVYDEGLNTERDSLGVGTPRLPLSNGRSVRIKYTYTWTV